MYLLQSKACNMPNSETPMTAERIARQDRFVAEVGRRFTDGNRAMADVIARLTPPPASGACDDFTSSASMSNLTPFPWPVPGAGGFPGLAPGAGPGGWSTRDFRRVGVDQTGRRFYLSVGPYSARIVATDSTVELRGSWRRSGPGGFGG